MRREPATVEHLDGREIGQFTKKSRRATIVLAGAHADPSCTEKRNACPESAGSSHDMYTRPSGPTVKFGSALPGPAGLARLSMANAPPEGAGAPPRMPSAATAEAARTTSSKWRLSMTLCAVVEMSSARDRKDECSPVHIPVGTRACRGRQNLYRSDIPQPGAIHDHGSRITLCGDWCAGARVEDAYLSGLAGAAL